MKRHETARGYDPHPIGMTMQFPVADQTRVNEPLLRRRAEWISTGYDDERFADGGHPTAPGSEPSRWFADPPPADGANIDVSWTAAVDNGSAVTGYLATVSPGGQSCVPTPANGTGCSIAGLLDGHYTVTVRATNALGDGPVASVPVTVDTVAPAVTAPVVTLRSGLAMTGTQRARIDRVVGERPDIRRRGYDARAAGRQRRRLVRPGAHDGDGDELPAHAAIEHEHLPLPRSGRRRQWQRLGERDRAEERFDVTNRTTTDGEPIEAPEPPGARQGAVHGRSRGRLPGARRLTSHRGPPRCRS